MDYLKKLSRFIFPYKKYAVLNIISNILYALFSTLAMVSLMPMINVLFGEGKKVYQKPLYTGIDSLKDYESKHGILKLSDENYLSLYRVILYITKANGNSGPSYTKYELRIAKFEYITKKIRDYKVIYNSYRITRQSFDHFTKHICTSLGT